VLPSLKQIDIPIADNSPITAKTKQKLTSKSNISNNNALHQPRYRLFQAKQGAVIPRTDAGGYELQGLGDELFGERRRGKSVNA
jgi:hypothetical protein